MINLRFAPMDCFHPTLTLMTPQTHGRCLPQPTMPSTVTSHRKAELHWGATCPHSQIGCSGNVFDRHLRHCFNKKVETTPCGVGKCLEALPSYLEKKNWWIPTWQHFFVTPLFWEWISKARNLKEITIMATKSLHGRNSLLNSRLASYNVHQTLATIHRM